MTQRHSLLRVAAGAFVLLITTSVRAEIGDLAADQVVGQSDFTSRVALPIDAASFALPHGVAVDVSHTPNRVYVSDRKYSRILGWSNADDLASGAAADIVIGQPDFQSWGCNRQSYNNGVPPTPTLDSVCSPSGMAVDRSGNLYVADELNCRILIFFDPFGTDLVADRVLGQSGVCDGVVVNGSKLFDPRGVAVDASGNVFVADTLNRRVVEYDNPLTGDNLADRVFGQSSLTARDSQVLYFPESVSIAPDGTLYVGTGTQVVGYDNPLADSVIDRLIGTQQCNESGENASSTCGAIAVNVDGQGRLYVGDTGNSRVLLFADPRHANQALRVFGQPGFGGATDLFHDACNNGGASASSLCLRKVRLLVLGGTYDEGAAVATDSDGRLYVADTLNHRVMRYDDPVDRQTADLVLGHPSTTDIREPILPMTAPQVAADNSFYTLIGLDTDGSRILFYPSLGDSVLPVQVIGQPDLTTTGCNSDGVSATSLCNPSAAVVDNSGNLWVADTGNNRVVEYTYPVFTYDYTLRRYIVNGTATRVFGQADFSSHACRTGADGLCQPKGVALDALFNLFIADSGNNRVLHHENPLADNVAERVYGQADFKGTSCADSADASSLCDPRGILVDGDGNLFIADRGNNRVVEYEKVDANGGGADRIFGQNSDPTATQCRGDADGLCGPSGVGIDRGGNLFVADTSNNRVLEFDAPLTDVKADRVFGQPDFTSTDCPGKTTAEDRLCQPGSVAIARYGDAVLVADTGNQRIVRYDAPFCIDDFHRTANTPRVRGLRSIANKVTLKIAPGLDPSVDDDILSFSSDLVLLENDGGISGSDTPLLTLTAGGREIYKERVPYLSNTRLSGSTETWEARWLEGERDKGIDIFVYKSKFVIPHRDTMPQHANIKYQGRAVGQDFSSFTETSATWRAQWGSICFTTDLSCSGHGFRNCKPPR